VSDSNLNLLSSRDNSYNDAQQQQGQLRRPPSRNEFGSSSSNGYSRERERGDEFSAPGNNNNAGNVEIGDIKEWEEDESTRGLLSLFHFLASVPIADENLVGAPVLQLYGISTLSPVRPLANRSVA
jgi:hypothetical protein